jgi:3'-phosphoadenosine 5'-phosphosulfate (PAPS) 3'-phosphatase
LGGGRWTPGEGASFLKICSKKYLSQKALTSGHFCVFLQDAYVHVTLIKKWDICPGDALLAAMGGKFTTLSGQGSIL